MRRERELQRRTKKKKERRISEAQREREREGERRKSITERMLFSTGVLSRRHCIINKPQCGSN
jgi:hypothetical protein